MLSDPVELLADESLNDELLAALSELIELLAEASLELEKSDDETPPDNMSLDVLSAPVGAEDSTLLGPHSVT